MAHVLVAEGDGVVRRFLAGALSERGHCVTAVADTAEAERALARTRFDLALIDYEDPLFNGLAVATAARRREPSPKVVLMAVAAARLDHARRLSRLVDGVLPKRLLPSGLAPILFEMGIESIGWFGRPIIDQQDAVVSEVLLLPGPDLRNA